MEEVSVSSGGGEVRIDQGQGEEGDTIILSIEQVPLLIQWLQQALDEAGMASSDPPAGTGKVHIL